MAINTKGEKETEERRGSGKMMSDETFRMQSKSLIKLKTNYDSHKTTAIKNVFFHRYAQPIPFMIR